MDIAEYILLIPVILFSLTIHEYMHGWTAYKLGDNTPALAGRLTMNPLSHLDPLGTLMLFIARFGWAKPVPVNPYNFRHPLRDMAIVAFAGPLSNLIAGVIAGVGIRLIFGTVSFYNVGNPVLILLFLLMQINLALAFFNLIPIHPLDGSKILLFALPHQYREDFWKIQQSGPFIIFAMLIAEFLFKIPIFYYLIWFPVNLITSMIL